MKNLYTFLLICLCPLFSLAQADSVIINFNDYETGNLGGQDGWISVDHWNGGNDFQVGVGVGADATIDGTNGANYNFGGPGVGTTSTKKTFDNFEMDFTNGGTFELQVDIYRNWWGEFIGIGYDANNNGYISNGIPGEEEDGGIILSIGGVDFPNRNNVGVSEGTSAVFNINNEGWIRYRLFVDLDGNGGEGQAALSYKTPPYDGDWISVSEIQGINLGLTPGSGDRNDPATWNGLFFHSQGGLGFFDNIAIRKTDSGGLSPNFIDFETPDKQFTTTPSIDLLATATSGLPVNFEVLSGPATVMGNTLSITGSEGIVVVEATEPGDGSNWAAASPVSISFEVINPAFYAPYITVRNAVDEETVMMPDLNTVRLVASSFIEHEDVLFVDELVFNVDGQNFTAQDWGTGYYTANWTPSDYGIYTMAVTATSNTGVAYTETISFEVVSEAADMTVTALDNVVLDISQGDSIADYILPSFVGSFDKITAHLDILCPAGGCDPWDRISNIEVRAPNGVWVELIRYITPYGVACTHSLDVTDYASLLQGKVEIRASLGTFGNGFSYNLDFEYEEGTPDYKYSWVDVIWDETYPFGNMDNLQPVDTINFTYAPNAEASKFKVVNTGHGWGENNTSNAAEFYEATHKIKVNDDSYNQHLWVDCNPNPDNCQPQNGTWFHDRAGWCPGSIGKVYDYNMDTYVGQNNVKLVYEFFPGYVDLCSSANPGCISGITCADCEDGFNPVYIVAGNLISYSNSPVDGITGTTSLAFTDFSLDIKPNPSSGLFQISTTQSLDEVRFIVFDFTGKILFEKTLGNSFAGFNETLDLSHFPAGVYSLVVQTNMGIQSKRLVKQ